jgi:hypothetical protein
MLAYYDNEVQIHCIKLESEYVTKFKYLGKTLTNQNFLYELIKSILSLENVCYHSVQNVFIFPSED